MSRELMRNIRGGTHFYQGFIALEQRIELYSETLRIRTTYRESFLTPWIRF